MIWRLGALLAGATLGLLPVLAAVSTRLGPPAWVWLVLSGLATAVASWRALRVRDPARRPRPVALSWLWAPLASALACGLVALGYGLLPTPPEPFEGEFRAAIFDVDSRVALRPRARCAPRLSGLRVVSERGAAPRLGADGSIWFEARGEDGRFQIHRVRAGGPLHCWTCDEPGNNRRPAPHPVGQSVLFDSDRFATWRHPNDTEVMLIGARGEERPRHPARRLTRRPGPDDHALYDPSGAGFVWSSGERGRYEVLRASVLSGHGGLLLSSPVALAQGRTAWAIPIAWAADARTLVVARGQPLAPLAGERIDPATGERHALAGALVAGSVAFSADGSTMAVASTEAAGLGGFVPAALGNVLARWPNAPAPRAEATRVSIGPVGAALTGLELGPLASWGAPTGIALHPDARSFVLGQRGPEGERIVEVQLECEAGGEGTGDTARRAGRGSVS